jgi:RND family efflux transporter MFP subunit
VLTKYADVGEIVAPFGSSGNTRGAVVDLADMRSLEVEADVSESNIERVTVGQPCEIILDAYPEVRYKGAVKKIVPTADRTRATVMTKVIFDQLDERVLPEMSARVNFFDRDTVSQAANIITASIPNTALVSRGDSKIVFTILDNKAQENEVFTGKKLGSLTEITRGLRPGDKVIVSPPSNLKTGDRVKIVE